MRKFLTAIVAVAVIGLAALSPKPGGAVAAAGTAAAMAGVVAAGAGAAAGAGVPVRLLPAPWSAAQSRPGHTLRTTTATALIIPTARILMRTAAAGGCGTVTTGFAPATDAAG
jgi:hypothetical protein